MQAISINPHQKSIDLLSIEMKADTVYTFFSSILIDEITSLNSHTIYTDANALEENKIPYFLGDQLLLGTVLITGNSAEGDTDVHVGIEILEELLSYEVSLFYRDSLKILSQTDINIYHLFSVEKDTQKLEINIEWVLATFNIADEKTKEYFLKEIKLSLESNNTQKVIEKLGQLAMNVV